jgi:hypothetical protein
MMHPLYVPPPGTRVRVTEVAPFDEYPEHKVGDEVVIGETWQENDIGVPERYPGWLILNCGTFCRVEPAISWCCPECDGEGTIPDVNGHDRSDLEGGEEEMAEGRIECALCDGTGETR